MNTVIPISITQINWPDFIRKTNEATGRSPTRNLDAVGIKLDKPGAFILALDAFIGNDQNIWKSMTNARQCLRHISMGFLIDTRQTEYIEFLQEAGNIRIETADNVGINEYLILATGTIYDWRRLILDLKSDSHLTEFRVIINQIHSFLDQAGFVDLWRDYRKRSLIDGTFVMEKV